MAKTTILTITLPGTSASAVTSVTVATGSGTTTFKASASGFDSSDPKASCDAEESLSGFPGPVTEGSGN